MAVMGIGTCLSLPGNYRLFVGHIVWKPPLMILLFPDTALQYCELLLCKWGPSLLSRHPYGPICQQQLHLCSGRIPEERLLQGLQSRHLLGTKAPPLQFWGDAIKGLFNSKTYPPLFRPAKINFELALAAYTISFHSNNLHLSPLCVLSI